MAAEAVGVSCEIVEAYRKAHPEFGKAEEEAELYAQEQVENALYQAASSGNVPAMVFYLSNRKPDKWKNLKKRDVKLEMGRLADEIEKAFNELHGRRK